MPFWALAHEYHCAVIAPRATVHAIRWRPPYRSLCGVDVKPFGVETRTTNTDIVDGLIIPWPPPLIDRCPDCAEITGIGRRLPKGSPSWRLHIDGEAA